MALSVIKNRQIMFKTLKEKQKQCATEVQRRGRFSGVRGKREKMLSLEALANFHDGNTPTGAKFKLPKHY